MISKTLSLFLAVLFVFCARAYANTFIVTSNADSGPGSLREAITLANSNGTSTKDSILFNLPSLTIADRTITLTSELPALTSNIIIDGSSQTGNVFGISSAKVVVFVNLNPNTDFLFNGLNADNVRDIEVYGIYFKCNANSFYFGGVAIRCKGARNIKVGAPGKGNIFTGWLAGIGYPEGYNTPDSESDSVFIQSNIFGLLEDGNTTTYGINPYVTIDACCRYSIFFRAIRDIQIGGAGVDEGNLINFVGQGISLTKTYNTPPSNYCRIINNRIGCNASGTVCTTSGYTNYSCVEVSGNDGLVAIGNHIMGQDRIAGLDITGTDSCIIKNNKINVDTAGNHCNSSLFQGIIVEFVKNGLIGGDQPEDKNTVAFTSGNAGIFLFMAYQVTVSRNSTYCNNAWGSIALTGWYNDVGSGPEPVISANYKTANSIGGKARPNSKIELFIDDSCSLCEGKLYIATLFADQNGDWSYTGNDVDHIVATATDTAGSTSEFTRGELDELAQPVIKNATCGQNNGSITNVHIISGTSWYWEDFNGNVVSTDTNLTNVGPGRYRLVIIIGSVFCSNKTMYYEIKNISLPVSMTPVVQSAQCGQADGAITTSYNTYELSGVWTNSAGDTVGIFPNLYNVPPGTYYLTLHVILDTACWQTYGPFVVPNQTGPSLNTNNMQIIAATCYNSNGSIVNISSLNVTGSPFIQWLDSLNNVVGNSLNLLSQPAGKYKLKFKDQSSCDTIITPFFMITAIGRITIDTTGKIITGAGCTINNGSIRNIKVIGADTYQWQNVPGNTTAGTTIDIYNLTVGNYQLTASNATGCSAISPVINVPQASFITIGVTGSQARNASCGMNNGLLRIVNFNKDSNYYSFKWIDSVTNQQLATGTALYNIGAGTYLLMATDSNGCEKQIFKGTIGAYPKPVFDLSRLKINNDKCARGEGSITGITVVGFPGSVTYLWKDIGNNVIGNTLDLANLHAGQYFLAVSDGIQCTVQSDTFTIANTNDPGLVLQYDDQTIPRNYPATLTIKNFQTGTYSLYSDPACTQLQQQNTTGIFTTAALAADADYYIRLVSGACQSAVAHVKVTVVDKSFFAIASAFTPNHDGVNDQLSLKVIGYINVEYFKIFNRNGEQVFFTKTVNDGWNGTHKGIEQTSGVYVWMAKGKDINGRVITAKGTFVLIR